MYAKCMMHPYWHKKPKMSGGLPDGHKTQDKTTDAKKGM
jgi:hypothetical protein